MFVGGIGSILMSRERFVAWEQSRSARAFETPARGFAC
jgi:hypothetical protein